MLLMPLHVTDFWFQDKRVSEVQRKSQSVEQAQRTSTLEQSQKKLAVAEELRQQRLDQLVEKLKEHVCALFSSPPIQYLHLIFV